MSVWAESWAFEQSVSPCGAKFVLVALANFADENGYCYPGQETLATMTGQTDRTVRTHLDQLVSLGLIERGHRYTKSGQRTSDGYTLQAPAERLRPRLPENSSASKGDYRKVLQPLPENSSGSLPENISGYPSVPEPSEEKKEVGSRKRSPSVKKMSDEEFQTFLKSNPAYSHLDLVREAGKMRAYCATKNKQPTRAYFVAWLNRIDPPLMPDKSPPEHSPPVETKEQKQKRLAQRFNGRSP